MLTRGSIPVFGRRLAATLADGRSAFVIVNLATNAIVLVRSYVAMQWLEYGELGAVALLQSLLVIIGALQFGLLNGGYRLLCSADEPERRAIVNQVYTLLSGIALVLLILTALIGTTVSETMWLVYGLGAIGGIATLYRTWMLNQMIAAGSLVTLNRVNLVSALLSVAILIPIAWAPLPIAMLSIICQPLLFTIGAAVLDRSLLPRAIDFSTPRFKRIMQAGFILFLTGMLFQLNLQAERWYVSGTLGLEPLGHLYLAVLFTTLFQIVPTSLDQIFLPPIVKAYEAGETDSLRRNLRRFMLVVGAYCAGVALALALFAQPIVALVLPDYVPDLRYVNLITPGLVLFALAGPFAIMFNVLIDYRYFIWSYGLGSAFLAVVLLGSLATGAILSLEGVSGLRTLTLGLMAAVLVFGYLRMVRRFPAFGFLRASRGP